MPPRDQAGVHILPRPSHLAGQQAEGDEYDKTKEEGGDEEDDLKDFPGAAEVEGVHRREPHPPGDVKEHQCNENSSKLSQPILISRAGVALASQALVNTRADEEASEGQEVDDAPGQDEAIPIRLIHWTAAGKENVFGR